MQRNHNKRGNYYFTLKKETSKYEKAVELAVTCLDSSFFPQSSIFYNIRIFLWHTHVQSEPI